jgi:tripartite-type tricarboxylate transporter receptor subunit TctC
VVKAAPDGYTLLAASSGPISIMPVLQKTPYDPLKDLAPVSLIAKGAFALVTAKRSAALPDVPTLAEAADLPDYDAAAWIGFAAPPGTPREMLVRLAGEIQKPVAGDDLKERYIPSGWTPYRPRLTRWRSCGASRTATPRSSGTRTSRSSSSRNGARRRSSPRSRRS